ncbi:pentapeptide repeat-containing protein [Aquimarina gracilis]|uniref:Pentapeptide repeat-containing protein n=1 Tax=Aquimarina gracilis TaxID=874422 RepID=A0ABU5ZXP2_9FLAO|nr:pentapeptide repeat-containing protein [Aquimarina gracilis]MEB3346644.1 pentapeptide repeat-containing protein [Aquimarina gracilis]
MNHPILDQTFENQNFSGKKLLAKEYDNCTFANCDFTEANMSVVTFLECTFDTCNFGATMLKETSFQEVIFKDCKMLGSDFTSCNDFMFSVRFDHCNLEYSSFSGFAMKNTMFTSCSLKEVDFTDTDITGSVFADCNLKNAIFENTIAENVDFRTAKHFIIDPEKNRLKKAKFSTTGLEGLLRKYNLNIE